MGRLVYRAAWAAWLADAGKIMIPLEYVFIAAFSLAFIAHILDVFSEWLFGGDGT